MAFKTSEKYKSVIYSGDCRHKLKLLFNGVELADADIYCESLKVTSRIIPNGSTRFSLDNFIAKEAELVLHDIDTTIIQSPVNISIGTLVDGTYEYVPIGLFVVQDLPTTDKNKTTIKLRDYAVKFDFGYNAKDIIDENGGSVTKLQILQDICNKAGVETDITKFYGSNSKIGIYDNSITARTYISYLAEQAGAIATIDRSGKLIFVQLKDLETVEIPLNIVEKYEDGEKYEISRVVYEDAIRKFEYGDESKDTLFINTANPYIDDEVLTNTLTGTQIETSDSADAEVVNYKQYGITKQETTTGKNLASNNYSDYTYAGVYAIYPVTLEQGETYTLSAKLVGELKTNYYNYGIVKNGTTYSDFEGLVTCIDYGTGAVTNRTFTVDSTYTSPKLVCYISSSTPQAKFEELFINYEIQFEKSSSTTDYEPYTGGQPSPNPDYPQEIEVGRGKNLLSEKTEITTNTYFYKDNGFKVKAGTTYTLSCDTTFAGLYVVKKDDNTNLFVAYNKTLLTFTPIEDTLVYFNFYFTDNKATQYQLEKGSVATSYLPYNTIEIKSTGKNLLDTDILSYSFEANTDGYVQETNIGFGKVTLNANTKYYISYDVVETGTTNVRNTAMLVPTDGSGYKYQYIGTYNTTTGRKVWEFTPAETKEYIVNYWCHTSDKKVTIANMMVSTDSDTEYEPYKESSITYNLGDNFLADKDYIENGVLNKNVGKVVLNGTEEWAINQTTTNHISFYTGFSPYKDIAIGKSDLFGDIRVWGGDVNNAAEEAMWNHNNGTSFGIKILKSRLVSEDVAGFKQWLSENPVTVYYELATPEQIQLETTGELRTFEPNTIITNDLDSEMEVEYARNQTQVSQILELNKDIPLNSFKTGKIIGNPAIDAYDIIKIVDDNKEFKTLATNDLTYNGVMINTFDTQIGKEAKKENVTLTPEATFKKWAKTEIDNVEAEVRINTGNIQTVKDEMGNIYTKGQVNELVANAETGVTNTFSEAGGNNEIRNSSLWFKNTAKDAEENPYEFWKGKANEGDNDKATNSRSILLGKGSFIHDDIEVPNGNYSISFYYRKLISNAVASVVINGKEYPLDSLETKQFYTGEQDSETGEYIVDPIVVSNNHIKIEFKCDALDGVEVYDLMCNKGTVKLAYSQNQNEITTSTVNISKGITITSSVDENTKFKADYDGIRVLDGNNNPKTTFTDKGTETDELVVRKKATITGLLHQEVDDQTWVTKI